MLTLRRARAPLKRRDNLGRTTRPAGPLQRKANSSAAVRHLVDLQHRADRAMSPARSVTSQHPIQRYVTFPNANSNSGGMESHQSYYANYIHTDLITRLEALFTDTGVAPKNGWKGWVWQQEHSAKEYRYGSLDDLADEALRCFPPSNKTQHEDPKFRALIDSYGGKGTKPQRQSTGLHMIAQTGSQTHQQQMLTYLQHSHNREGLTASTRHGEQNETLLTSDAVDAFLRSMGAMQGVEADVPADDDRDPSGPSGKQSPTNETWTSFQTKTSAPTDFFTFTGTTAGEGGLYQDTHINGRTYRVDKAKKRHPTIGATSPKYHLGKTDSLASNFRKSTHLTSLARRNFKLHFRMLAKKDDIANVSADKRGPQLYNTRSGTTLNLSNTVDLIRYARIMHRHRNKVLTLLRRYERRLKPRDEKLLSESEIDDSKYTFTEEEMEANSDR